MKVRLFGLMMLVLAVASQASAVEPSRATLESMGLAGLEVMSDNDAMSVRGFGYRGTSANGKSFAVVSIPGASAGSTNGYNAKGSKYSSGANLSVAGAIVETGGGHGGGGGHSSKGGKGGHGGGKPQSVAVVAFGGGFSVAKTK